MAAVTHSGFCTHRSTWMADALDEAMACSGMSMTRSERRSVLDSLMAGERVWHDGALIEGRLS